MEYAAVTTHYADQQIARDYDRVRFSSPIGRLFDALERRALRRMLAVVRREIPQPNVLDAPCGTGRITRVWLEQGLVVKGGDISPAMIELAKEKCASFGDRVTFSQMDLEREQFAEERYDLVSCIRLLHHLESADRISVLQGLARATKRFVIVNIPYSSPYYRGRRRLKRLLGQGISRTSVTWREITNEARRAGLQIVQSRFMAPLLSENLMLLLVRTDSHA